MGKARKLKLATIILSLAFIGVPAGQAAYAAPASAAPTAKVPSSGIGLAANLPQKGEGVLRNSTYFERASKSRLWAPTPAGMVYRSCVYDVSNNSYVDSIHDRITEPNGRVLPMKPCAYPRLTSAGAATASTAKTATAGSLARSNGNWIDGFEADNLPHLGGLSVSLSAPYPPNNTNSSLWEYQWTALQSSDGQSLLQPAVGYGPLAVSNYRPPLAGDNEMASYYFWGGNSVAGTFYSVNPLDTLDSSTVASNCGSGGGACTWNMQIHDEKTGQTSTLKVGSSPVYTGVVGELESNVGSVSGANCQSLFANHHLVWRKLQVQTESLSVVSPSYYDTGTIDANPGAAVRSDSKMGTTWSTSGGLTAADTTWSNGCTGF